MTYERVSFNDKWVLKFESAEEFADHITNKHLWPKVSIEVRRQRLLEVHVLIKAVHNANSV